MFFKLPKRMSNSYLMIFLKFPYCGVLKMVKSNISQCNVIMATSEDIDQTRAKCVAKHENINTGIKTKNGQKKSGWIIGGICILFRA
jgi:hypothetical protein